MTEGEFDTCTGRALVFTSVSYLRAFRIVYRETSVDMSRKVGLPRPMWPLLAADFCYGSKVRVPVAVKWSPHYPQKLPALLRRNNL